LLRALDTEAERLTRLADDLPVVARPADDLVLRLEPVLVQRLVPPLLTAEAGRWPGVRFASFLPSSTPSVSGDPDALRHALRNLLTDAATFGGPGRVDVVAVRTAGFLDVIVPDHGPGIEPERAEVVFAAFVRGPRGFAGGPGLGLAACRRLIASMGGSVRAVDARIGARIVVRMPVMQPDDDDGPSDPGVDQPARRPAASR
jgi:signal transduction histidine kinase